MQQLREATPSRSSPPAIGIPEELASPQSIRRTGRSATSPGVIPIMQTNSPTRPTTKEDDEEEGSDASSMSGRTETKPALSMATTIPMALTPNRNRYQQQQGQQSQQSQQQLRHSITLSPERLKNLSRSRRRGRRSSIRRASLSIPGVSPALSPMASGVGTPIRHIPLTPLASWDAGGRASIEEQQKQEQHRMQMMGMLQRSNERVQTVSD